MSETPAEVTAPPAGEEEKPNPDAELAPSGNDAFAALMDAMVTDENAQAAAAGDTPATPPASPDGQPAAPAEGTQPAGTPATPPASGDDGKPAVPDPAADTGAGAPAAGKPAESGAAEGTQPAAQPATAPVGLPADWTRPVEEVLPEIEQMSTNFETRIMLSTSKPSTSIRVSWSARRFRIFGRARARRTSRR
jgi:hypothetical protein